MSFVVQRERRVVNVFVEDDVKEGDFHPVDKVLGGTDSVCYKVVLPDHKIENTW
jgi:hypothetical protein